MNILSAYQNRVFLADGERFAPYIQKALARPCPSAADVRAAHREWMTLAATAAERAVQGTGRDCPTEEGHAAMNVIADMNGGKTMMEAPKAIRAVKQKIGIIPVMGPIDQRTSPELEKSGGTPCDFIGAAFDALLQNPAIGAIVLRMDTPGGSVSGIEELASKIVKARGQKPIYAHVDSMAASAGYWLASAADMIVCTPGGEVGSVGVFIAHVDQSAALEQDGLSVTLIHAGKNKVEFSPYAPLSDDAKAELQGRVNDIYSRFTGALSSNLNVPIAKVRSDFGEGRTVSAQKALSLGMVHRVLSWDDFISKLMGGASQPANSSKASAADVARIGIGRARRERAG